MTLSIYFVTPDGVEDAMVAAALRGGATLVQLRDKTARDADMIAQARRLKRMLAPFGVPLIVNDRLDVALAAGADGLHIGQSDGDPEAMRRALGPDRLLGLSIENEGQLAHVPDCVDYLGVGPLRDTHIKPDAAPALGLEALGRIVRAAPLPSVAIGAVGLGDVPRLKALGCAGIAVVSAISEAPDPEAATRALADAWRSA